MDTVGSSSQNVGAEDYSAKGHTSQEAESCEHETSRTKPAHHITVLRMAGLILYFLINCICIHSQQFLGLPLYWFNQDWYYTWQALAKQYFGVLLVTVQEWWSPMNMRITGDKSIKGQIRALRNGRIQIDFPERILIVSNHQIYTDWIFMWWSAFTQRMHGHFYIILKESLRFIPMLGPGMMFFSFLFLSRNWEKDKPRFQHRLRKLKTAHSGPMSGNNNLDPMWLLIFPEGTTLSTNGRSSSRKWANKNDIPDLKHCLLPRSRGLQLCLQELQGTLDYLYDCTISYDGIPPGQYGQDYFTLWRTYIEGRGPPFCNMHWRRFPISSIPIHDSVAFDAWLLDRWIEKDDLLEYASVHGHFPADEDAITYDDGSTPPTAPAKRTGIVSATIKPGGPLEFITIFSSALAVPIVWKLTVYVWRIFNLVLYLYSCRHIHS